jgi:hypothetical protein
LPWDCSQNQYNARLIGRQGGFVEFVETESVVDGGQLEGGVAASGFYNRPSVVGGSAMQLDEVLFLGDQYAFAVAARSITRYSSGVSRTFGSVDIYF